MPAGATYIYNLNFFCGFIVAGGTYWVLCRFFPIPATSEYWNEVGEEIRNVSVAYGAGEGPFDEASRSGSERDYKGGDKTVEEYRSEDVDKDIEAGVVRERKTAGNF